MGGERSCELEPGAIPALRRSIRGVGSGAGRSRQASHEELYPAPAGWWSRLEADGDRVPPWSSPAVPSRSWPWRSEAGGPASREARPGSPGGLPPPGRAKEWHRPYGRSARPGPRGPAPVGSPLPRPSGQTSVRPGAASREPIGRSISSTNNCLSRQVAATTLGRPTSRLVLYRSDRSAGRGGATIPGVRGVSGCRSVFYRSSAASRGAVRAFSRRLWKPFSPERLAAKDSRRPDGQGQRR